MTARITRTVIGPFAVLPEAVRRKDEYTFPRTSSNSCCAEAVGVLHIVLALLAALRFFSITEQQENPVDPLPSHPRQCPSGHQKIGLSKV